MEGQLFKKENNEKGKYMGMSKWMFTKENYNDHIFLKKKGSFQYNFSHC
jgi:hypothetical protein